MNDFGHFLQTYGFSLVSTEAVRGFGEEGIGDATHGTDRGAGDAPTEQTSENIAGIGKSGQP